MTPDEWFAAVTPDRMLEFHGQTSYPRPRLSPEVVRRLSLFGCACARMVWDLLPTDARSSIQVRELFADGKASKTDLRASAVRGDSTVGFTFRHYALDAAALDPAAAARSAAKALATRAAGHCPNGHGRKSDHWHEKWTREFALARLTQSHYLRDLFPPPGYTPTLAPEWLTSTVVALARQMDESGDFSATPILADALEDAGCNDRLPLENGRVPGNVHIRGNWVVDLVLGRK